MKKTWKMLIATVCAAVMAVGFAACDFGKDESAKSAYQIAVENGFTGTEQEWLNSLRGANGSDGSDLQIEDVYLTAQQNGYEGSFLDFLKEYLTVNVAENNDTQTIAHNMMSVVGVYCGFTVTKTVTGFFGVVTTETQTVTSAGSGVIVDLNKDAGTAYVVTNYHVIYDADADSKISDSIYLYLYGDLNTFSSKTGRDDENGIRATYVGGSMNYDIALLEVQGSDVLLESNAEKAVIGDSETLVAGEKVYAIGNPEGSGISVTEGVVSMDSEYISLTGSDEKTEVNLRVIRTDAAINAGNSGGGLFDAEGKLIGITNAKMVDQFQSNLQGEIVSLDESVDNIGYALPINQVGAVVDNIRYNGGQVKLAQFGITLQTTASKAEINAEGKAEIREEVAVASVNEGGAADGFLQEGDVIRSVALGDTELTVTRRYQLIDFMLNVRPGDSVVLTVERNGAETKVTVPFDEDSYFLAVA